MTLTSLLAPSIGSPSAAGSDYLLPHDVDRTAWGGGKKGGWKGGKGNPNAALSALTLLAFLFFLNILQSCLKDQVGHSGMMVVMLPNGTGEVTRIKREIPSVRNNHGHNYTTSSYPNATLLEFQMLDHIHSLVEYHWSHRRPLSIGTSYGYA